MVEENEISVFSFLPEGCTAHVIAFTSPKDACRASAVSWAFKAASESDTVWEKLLPSDYKEIISKSVTPLNFSTKKELFFRFCDSPVLLDDGKLSFSLSKLNGKKCYMLCARELSIAWKDTPIYRTWKSIPESRFSEVAELLNACWLEIRGKMNTIMLSLKTNYAAYLVFKAEDYSYGLDPVLGSSIEFSYNSSNGDESNSDYFSWPIYRYYCTGRRGMVPLQHNHGRFPQKRTDGWMEIHIGEFFNDHGDGEIEMRICTGNLDWKNGLTIEGIEVRPQGDP